jgi:hypothetical protein
MITSAPKRRWGGLGKAERPQSEETAEMAEMAESKTNSKMDKPKHQDGQETRKGGVKRKTRSRVLKCKLETLCELQ